MLLQLPHRADIEIELEDLSHPFGFGRIDHQLLVFRRIAKGNGTACPHALALRSSDLVADPLGRDLALELGEGQQYVQRQSPHGAQSVELLGDRHKRHLVGVETSTILAKSMSDRVSRSIL